MARKLPSFEYDWRLWTIDFRLREFRFLVFGESPEFVTFESERGRELLGAFALSKTMARRS